MQYVCEIFYYLKHELKQIRLQTATKFQPRNACGLNINMHSNNTYVHTYTYLHLQKMFSHE